MEVTIDETKQFKDEEFDDLPVGCLGPHTGTVDMSVNVSVADADTPVVVKCTGLEALKKWQAEENARLMAMSPDEREAYKRDKALKRKAAKEIKFQKKVDNEVSKRMKLIEKERLLKEKMRQADIQEGETELERYERQKRQRTIGTQVGGDCEVDPPPPKRWRPFSRQIQTPHVTIQNAYFGNGSSDLSNMARGLCDRDKEYDELYTQSSGDEEEETDN